LGKTTRSGNTYTIDYRDPLKSAWIKDTGDDGTRITLDGSPQTPTHQPRQNCEGDYGCGTPSSYDNKNGTVRIVVKNGNGNSTGFGWQNGLGFRYGYPAPIINSVSPSELSIVGGGTEGKFDVWGYNFVNGLTVK